MQPFDLRPAVLLSALCAMAGFGGCASAPPNGIPDQAITRWKQSHDYYALVEVVDRHIDPEWNGHISKADVLNCLGEGIHDPDLYPHSGPDFWVYCSTRPVPIGSYLCIEFGADGLVKELSWGSE